MKLFFLCLAIAVASAKPKSAAATRAPEWQREKPKLTHAPTTPAPTQHGHDPKAQREVLLTDAQKQGGKEQPDMPFTPLSAIAYTRLGDLVPSTSSVGWGSYQVNKRWYTEGFKIAGEVFTTGVYAHAPSDIRYHLERKYSFITGCVGLNDMNDGVPCGDGVNFHVVVNGETKWTQHQKGGEKVRCFKVDVREAETLQLVADHIIDHNCDESEWVNVKLYEDPVIDCQQLGALVPTYKSVGWGSYWVNKNWYMNGFLIDGVRYQHGVFAHADSHLIYPLKKKFHSFQACVGLDDAGGDCGDGVTFAVYADTRRIYSKDKDSGEGASCFHLDVTNVEELQLVVDKKQHNECDEAEWVNANLCTVKAQTVVDCKVGDFGDWNECSRSCGSGYQTRKRKITQSPSPHGGKRCPHLEESQKCNTNHCPIDCVETAWSAWGTCTQSCGTSGIQHRYRSIEVQNAYNGKACGDLMQTQNCGRKACPIDCVEGAWQPWGSCSKKCGGGVKSRTRTPEVEPKHGGMPCARNEETVSCNNTPCKVDCVASSLSEWGSCSRDCGTGYQTRSRKMLTKPRWGGKACTDMQQTKTCNTQACPVDCVTGKHAPWAKCSKTCGRGTQERHLSIDRQAAYGGKACPAELTQTRDCATAPCPVDCQESEFAPWGPCSKSCGTGYSDRKRTVLVEAENGGRACPHMYERRQCNKHFCPEDCALSDFGAWQPCTKTCGGGESIKRRTILVKPKFGGKACSTVHCTDVNGAQAKCEMTQSKPCAQKACPQDCETSMWSAWSDCTKSCGGGTKTRSRAVTAVAEHGGATCPGLRELLTCGTVLCPQDCTVGEWGPWSGCTKECELGTQMRIRSKITGNRNGGKNCPALKEHRYCNAHVCPLDCKLSQWGNFKACSKTCGAGTKTRYRHINQMPKGSGAQCGGLEDPQPCNEGDCPVNCKMEAWEAWGKCSKGCGGGEQERVRGVKNEPAYGGTICPHARETRTCNEHHCPIHCEVSDPKAWGACSRTCGSGIMLKRRTITRHAMFGGKGCGELVTEASCNTKPCAVDCEMGPWGPWDKCSKPCEMGFQTHHRKVMRKAQHGGKACTKTSEARFCNTFKCPTNCTVGKWASWTKCGKTCGGGVKQRTRQITTHPANGGDACPTLREEQSCNSGPCPIDCVPTYWGSYSECYTDKGCGKGTRTRQRFVDIEAQHGGSNDACKVLTDSIACDAGPCAVDCAVNDWGAWSDCSRSCGTGTHTRTRKVIQERTHGKNGAGARCPALTEEDQCEVYPCPMDCNLGIYEPWSTCTKSCGGGTQTRVRPVLSQAAYGGKCPAERQSRNCNTHACKLHKMWTETRPTPAPTPFDVAAAFANDHNVHAVQENGKARVRGTAPPTPATTAQVLDHTTHLACMNGEDTVRSGWHGAGYGDNYCNLCKCFDGQLSCQKKKCGAIHEGHVCSDVECEMVYSYAVKHKIMLVKHHHAENKGADHKCVNNPHTGKCTCHCFGKANTIWAPFSSK